MQTPDLVRPGRFRVGDTIKASKDHLGGTVEVFRDLSAERQHLILRDAAGGLSSMVVEFDSDRATVLSDLFDAKDARTLALLILAGNSPRIPINAQLNILAGALLAADEAKDAGS